MTITESAPVIETGAPTEKSNQQQPKYSTNGHLALKLAARGWFVFPCREKPGEPYMRDGELIIPEIKKPYWHKVDLPNGFKNATTDQAQIRTWWKRWPKALVGVYCEQSGIFAVDLDVKNGKNGLEGFQALILAHSGGEEFHFGPSQVTMNGGRHIIFRYPKEITVPNKEDALGPGIDLRSDGYFCTGGPYQWEDNHGPDAPLLDAPAWLVKLIANLKPKPPLTPPTLPPAPVKPTPGSTLMPKETWAQYMLDHLAPFRCENYDEWVKVGMALFELGEVGFTLWDAWSRRCPEKYEPGACEKRWKGFKPGKGITLGSLHHMYKEDNPNMKFPTVTAVRENPRQEIYVSEPELEMPDFEPWPEGYTETPPVQAEQEAIEESEEGILPLEALVPTLPKAACLPDELLYDLDKPGYWLTQYIDYAHQAAPKAPVIFHEILGLTLLSAAIARRVCIRVSNKNIYPNIFALIVANSTLYSKSTAFDTARQVLEKAGLRHLTLPESITPQNLISELTNRAQDTFSSWEKEDQEEWRKERAFSSQRAWLMDEAASLLDLFDQKNTEGLLSLILKLYDCPERLLALSTQARGRQTIRNAYLTVCGPTTPAAMRVHLANPAHWGNGLFARFAFVTPDTPPVDRFYPEPLEAPDSLCTPLQNLALKLLRVKDTNIEELQAPEVKRVELENGVRDYWKAYNSGVFTLLKDGEIPEKLSPNYGRFPDMAIKIAMQLASIDWAMAGNKDAPIIITKHHWARAQSIVERLRSSLHRLIENASRPSRDDDLEQKIISYLKRKPEGLSDRELAINLHMTEASKRLELDITTKRLINDGLIKKTTRKGNRGPGTEVYILSHTTHTLKNP